MNATRPNLDDDVNEYAADIDFDSDSNAAVSSSTGNVGSGEPSANKFQSLLGLGNFDSDEVKAIPGPATLDSHSNSPQCDSTITSLVDKHDAFTKSVVTVQQDSRKMKVRRSIS